MLDGYVAGLNLYAAQHRGDVLAGFAPAKPQDVVALFMLRLPTLYGLDNQLRALIAGNPEKISGDLSRLRSMAAAIAPARSADGATRLLINPQGPFGGPFSWYEARVNSAEGWNREGGVIPGSPVMFGRPVMLVPTLLVPVVIARTQVPGVPAAVQSQCTPAEST